MALVLKSKQSSKVVPDGIYEGVLKAVKTFSNAFGERVGFEFEITSGDHKGAVLMRSTSPVMGNRTGNLYKMLAGLLGRDLTQAEIEGGLDVEELVGTCCTLVVVKSANKQGQVFSNIDRVMSSV